MSHSPYKPREIFLSEVPKDLLKAIAQTVYKAYEESFEQCFKNYDKYQVHDLLPHLRKATIERNILQCVKRFPYAEAKSKTNFSGNCYHIVVRCGHVVLTVSSVQSRGQMVREAIFRKTYARDAQMSVFVDEQPIADLNGNLYAVLLHKPCEQSPDTPEFIVVQFPNNTLDKYLDDFIDLRKPLISQGHEEKIAKPSIAARKIEKVGNDLE